MPNVRTVNNLKNILWDNIISAETVSGKIAFSIVCKAIFGEKKRGKILFDCTISCGMESKTKFNVLNSKKFTTAASSWCSIYRWI